MTPLENIFIELANVKNVEYLTSLSEVTPEILSESSQASDGDLHVVLETSRDASLTGEGLMRDLARRVQSLRKELGFSPTDVLTSVCISGLDKKNREYIRPHLKTMAELVRSKEVTIQKPHSRIKLDWHDYKLDNNNISIAIF
jgi:isoleucyl-tRNA synthetase